MAATAGMHSYGSTFGWSGWTPAVYTSLGEVIDIKGPNLEIGDTKMSHLSSPDKFHEYIPAFGEGDAVEITINYEDDEFSTLDALKPLPTEVYPDYGRLSWLITLPDGGTVSFKGFLKGWSPDVPDDDRITVTMRIKVSGKPIFLPGGA